jgi:hypothetical protein
LQEWKNQSADANADAQLRQRYDDLVLQTRIQALERTVIQSCSELPNNNCDANSSNLDDEQDNNPAEQNKEDGDGSNDDEEITPPGTTGGFSQLPEPNGSNNCISPAMFNYFLIQFFFIDLFKLIIYSLFTGFVVTVIVI